MTAKNFLQIRKMEKEDLDQVGHLMAEIYHNREPVSVYYRDNFGETLEEIYEHYVVPEIEECAKEDLSFICVDHSLPKESQIIAFLLCRTLDFRHVDDKEDFNINAAFEALLNSCKEEFMALHPNVEKRHHLLLVAFGVKETNGLLGIASKPFQCTFNNAKERGFKFAFGMPTSNAARHIFSKGLKMKLLFSYPIDSIEYKGVKYFKNLTDPSTYVGYEIDFEQWNVAENTGNLHFKINDKLSKV